VATGWAIWLVYQYICSPLLNGLNGLFFPRTYKLPLIFGLQHPLGLAGGWYGLPFARLAVGLWLG